MIDWSEVVREHGPLVWRTSARLLRNEADTADCFQATFIAAIDFSRRQCVENWPALLVRLATARAIERLRSRIRASKHIEPIQADETEATAREVSPVEAAEASEISEAVLVALGRIEIRQAEVFCLACLDGLPYREIAAQLCLSESNVGVLLHRAKSALREELRQFDPRLKSAEGAAT